MGKSIMIEVAKCSFCGEEKEVTGSEDSKICAGCALLALQVLISELENSRL